MPLAVAVQLTVIFPLANAAAGVPGASGVVSVAAVPSGEMLLCTPAVETARTT